MIFVLYKDVVKGQFDSIHIGDVTRSGLTRTERLHSHVRPQALHAASFLLLFMKYPFAGIMLPGIAKFT